MSYLLYSLALLLLIMVTCESLPCFASIRLCFLQLMILVTYYTRDQWFAWSPFRSSSRLQLYDYVPSSFQEDAEAGLSSSDFDLGANVAEGDTRAGLDRAGKAEVLRIMKTRKVDFDEARRVYMEERFTRNNIGPDGRPKDPKFVSFS